MKEWIAESGANLGAGAAEGADSEKSEGSKIGEEALALRRRELDLVEQVVRVEDELKNLREVMEERFQKVDERFDQMEKRTSFSQWIIGIGFAAIGLLILVLNYFR